MSKKDPTNGELLVELKYIVAHLAELNGQTRKNTEFRIAHKAQIRVWQWVISVVGLSNLGLIIKLFG